MNAREGLLVVVGTVLFTAVAFLVLLQYDRAGLSSESGPMMDAQPERVEPTSSPFGQSEGRIIREETPNTVADPGPVGPPVDTEVLARAAKHQACLSTYMKPMERLAASMNDRVDKTWGALKAEVGVFYSPLLSECAAVIMLMSEDERFTSVFVFNAKTGTEMQFEGGDGEKIYEEFITHFEDLREAAGVR